jgi:hypothetical protein
MSHHLPRQWLSGSVTQFAFTETLHILPWCHSVLCCCLAHSVSAYIPACLFCDSLRQPQSRVSINLPYQDKKLLILPRPSAPQYPGERIRTPLSSKQGRIPAISEERDRKGCRMTDLRQTGDLYATTSKSRCYGWRHETILCSSRRLWLMTSLWSCPHRYLV